jgi:hypothetical protein
MIDSQFFMPGRHGVGTEYIDFKLPDEALQQSLAFLCFEVDGNGFFAGIGCNEIAVPVLPSHRPADVPVGIAFGLPARYRGGLQLDDTPAQMDEAKGCICQGKRLLDTDDGLRFQDSNFITYGKIDVKLGSFLANWKFFI